MGGGDRRFGGEYPWRAPGAPSIRVLCEWVGDHEPRRQVLQVQLLRTGDITYLVLDRVGIDQAAQQIFKLLLLARARLGIDAILERLGLDLIER